MSPQACVVRLVKTRSEKRAALEMDRATWNGRMAKPP
jgi:ribosomal 50S subunit-recycling heat shock protein